MTFGLTKTALVAAPLAMTAYGIARILGRIDGHYGPGPDWQIAHLLGLTGMVLFIPVVLALRRHATTGQTPATGHTVTDGRTTGRTVTTGRTDRTDGLAVGRTLVTTVTVTAAVTLLGLTATIVQFSADMLLAVAATDRDDLRRLQHDFSDIPGIQPAVYDFGPLLFFVGIVVMAALATRTRSLPRWSPALMLVAVLLPTADLNLMPATGLLMLAALWPLRSRTSSTEPALTNT
ncbi:hypothetical protein [Actinoplanes sp. CA-252034]|uniref:hypothetical protein n=1 Tax=Actinoplanes sp. CA-252034 TaxID=3239906 RepID=UPI003D950C75